VAEDYALSGRAILKTAGPFETIITAAGKSPGAGHNDRMSLLAGPCLVRRLRSATSGQEAAIVPDRLHPTQHGLRGMVGQFDEDAPTVGRIVDPCKHRSVCELPNPA